MKFNTGNAHGTHYRLPITDIEVNSSTAALVRIFPSDVSIITIAVGHRCNRRKIGYTAV